MGQSEIVRISERILELSSILGQGKNHFLLFLSLITKMSYLLWVELSLNLSLSLTLTLKLDYVAYRVSFINHFACDICSALVTSIIMFGVLPALLSSNILILFSGKLTVIESITVVKKTPQTEVD